MFNFKYFFLLQVITHTFSLANSQSTDSQSFCYDDTSCGPASPLWPGICQTGEAQSPINLPPPGWTTLFSPFKRLSFNGQYVSPEFYVTNNGHTVQLSFSPDLNSSATMSGYGLSEPYIFSQVHFHWGDSNSKGSEHTLGGKSYPMEMHLIHYSSRYPSVSAAEDSGDPAALAVLGVFIRPIQHEVFLLSQAKSVFNLISSNLPMEVTTSSISPVKVSQRLDLSHFLPKLSDGLYRYNGSLTSPPCSEQVVWTVKSTPVKVGLQGFQRFQSLMDERGLGLVNNFRPTQPRNGRSIEYFRKI